MMSFTDVSRRARTSCSRRTSNWSMPPPN
jgi:hypothetical protein